MTDHLPDAAVKADRRLEAVADRASDALCQHRWHWTLDQSNDQRVTFAQYARDVERDPQTIREAAGAYALVKAEGSDPSLTLASARSLVRMGSDRATVAEAVADARGITLDHARKRYGSEIRRLHASAAEAAERDGTSISETAPALADFAARSREGQARRRGQQQARHRAAWFAIDSELATVRRSLRAVLEAARDDVSLDAEERDALAFELGQVEALFRLARFALEGADIDWDAELAALDAARFQP